MKIGTKHIKLGKKILKKFRNKELKRKKKLKKIFLVGSLWAILIVCSGIMYLYMGMSFEEFLFFVYNYLQENILFGVIVFVIIYLIRPLLFLPATPFELIAAIVYGVWAIGIILLSITLSVTVNYLIGRRSKKYIEVGMQDSYILSSFRKYMKGDTFFNVLFLRLMPFPFDIGSFLCGVFRLKFFIYLIASLLGSIPSSIIIFLTGLAFYQERLESFDGMLNNVDTRLLSYAGIAFVCLYVCIFVLKKFILNERQ